MKKTLAIVLSIVMLLALTLTGCSSEKDELIGTWMGSIDITDYMNEAFAESDPLAAEYLQISNFTIRYYLIFNEDDTCALEVDETDLEDSFNQMLVEIEEGLRRYLEDEIAAMGVDMTVDEVMELSGTSLDQLMAESFTPDMYKEMVEEMESQGNFKVKDGKLMMSESLSTQPDPNVYELYSLAGNTLTIDKGNSSMDGDMEDLIYPMVLQKVS